MRVTSVSFGFTKNLGNYQSARSEATVEVSDNDDPYEAMALARVLVKQELDLPLGPDEAAIADRYLP